MTETDQTVDELQAEIVKLREELKASKLKVLETEDYNAHLRRALTYYIYSKWMRGNVEEDDGEVARVALAEKIHDVDWYTRLELAEDECNSLRLLIRPMLKEYKKYIDNGEDYYTVMLDSILSPTERVDTTELTLPEQLKVYMRYSEELLKTLTELCNIIRPSGLNLGGDTQVFAEGLLRLLQEDQKKKRPAGMQKI